MTVGRTVAAGSNSTPPSLTVVEHSAFRVNNRETHQDRQSGLYAEGPRRVMLDSFPAAAAWRHYCCRRDGRASRPLRSRLRGKPCEGFLVLHAAGVAFVCHRACHGQNTSLCSVHLGHSVCCILPVIRRSRGSELCWRYPHAFSWNALTREP